MINIAAKTLAKQPILLLAGVLIGFIIAFLSPAWITFVLEQYGNMHPVVRDWRVTEATVDGEDVTVSGVMRKTRDCLLVPPVIARDQRDKPYVVETPLWRNKDASPELQPFGPWKIVGGAGKRLTFVLVYMCGGNVPNIVTVGRYP
jgi:hypothetical protein